MNYIFNNIIIFLVSSIIFSCRYLNVSDVFLPSKSQFRCGKFHSFLYINTVEEEIYPDLGMLLEYKNELNLNKEAEDKIAEKARVCFELCLAEKELIRLQEENLKTKLLLNKDKKAFERLSAEFNEIRQMKKNWLQKHKKRYEEGVRILSPEEFEKWILLEKTVKPFTEDM